MFWVMGDGTMTKDERNDEEGQKYEEEDKKTEETKKNLSIQGLKNVILVLVDGLFNGIRWAL